MTPPTPPPSCSTRRVESRQARGLQVRAPSSSSCVQGHTSPTRKQTQKPWDVVGSRSSGAVGLWRNRHLSHIGRRKHEAAGTEGSSSQHWTKLKFSHLSCIKETPEPTWAHFVPSSRCNRKSCVLHVTLCTNNVWSECFLWTTNAVSSLFTQAKWFFTHWSSLNHWNHADSIQVWTNYHRMSLANFTFQWSLLNVFYKAVNLTGLFAETRSYCKCETSHRWVCCTHTRISTQFRWPHSVCCTGLYS